MITDKTVLRHVVKPHEKVSTSKTISFQGSPMTCVPKPHAKVSTSKVISFQNLTLRGQVENAFYFGDINFTLPWSIRDIKWGRVASCFSHITPSTSTLCCGTDPSSIASLVTLASQVHMGENVGGWVWHVLFYSISIPVHHSTSDLCTA